MNSIDHMFNSLNDYSNNEQNLPPIDQWNPDYCGEMDLLLKADGEWLHHGTPIVRKKMIVLFSKILKKEKERYFLVSPVEKIAIKVEWQPFVIIDFNVIEQAEENCFIFVDNCNNRILLNEIEQIKFSSYQGERLPVVRVRNNLYASFSRNCYYRLIEQARIISRNNCHQVQITSSGKVFSLGEVTESE